MSRVYSDSVLDHYRNPRNVGRLPGDDPAVGTGLAGSAQVGGVVRLQIRVDASGIIEETRFKAYGCGATIASASWASDALAGTSLQEARRIDSTKIIQALQLPAVKTWCAMLVQDALEAAVNDYQSKRESS